MLIERGANIFCRDIDGFSSSDFIFAKDSKFLKKKLADRMGKEKFLVFSEEYSENRVGELKRLLYSEEDILELIETVGKRDSNILTIIDSDGFLDDSFEEEIKEDSIIDNWFESKNKNCSERLPTNPDSPKTTLEVKRKELEEEALRKKIEFYKTEMERMKTGVKEIDKMEEKNKLLKAVLKKKKKAIWEKNKQIQCPYKEARIPSKEEKNSLQLITDSLNNELNNYYNWLESYKAKRRPFLDKLYRKLSKELTGYFNNEVLVSLAGSVANELNTPWSDLNITVTFKNNQQKSSKNMFKRLFQYLKTKNKSIDNLSVEERSDNSVVILRLNESCGFQRVEISLKRKQETAFPSTEETMASYIKAYPIVKILYTMFRTILHNNRLDDLTTNGMTNYSAFLLIIAFIQKLQLDYNSPTDKKNYFYNFITDPKNVGQITIKFLFFFSYEFDFYRQCLAPYLVDSPPTLSVFPKARNKTNKVYSLTIYSPYDRNNILTRHFKRTFELKQAFKLCYISLFQICSCRNLDPSPITKVISLKKQEERNKDFFLTEENFYTHINFLFGCEEGKTGRWKKRKSKAFAFNLARMKSKKTTEAKEENNGNLRKMSEMLLKNICDKNSSDKRNVVRKPVFSVYKLLGFNFVSLKNNK